MTNVYEKINVELPEEKAIALPQKTDDFTKIKGIGSGTAEKLNVRKIYTYRQLAEITPEKLSEAPGVGIATARKFIEEAKKLLEGIQEDNIVKLPEPSKEEPVIVQKIQKDAASEELKTSEITESEVKEDFKRKVGIQQRNVTPCKQLLARSDDKIENGITEFEEIETETETEVDNIETFEVAEVIVEEELPQEKFQREEKPFETTEKKWFSDKFNPSRLTASHPPVSKRSSQETEVEENFEPKEVTLQRNNTPYKQLLARSEVKVKNEISEIEEIGIKPISESESEFKVEVEEELEEVEEAREAEDKYQEKVPVRLENNLIVEPFESETSVPVEEIPREEDFNTPTYTEFPEVTEIPEIPVDTNIPEISEIPTSSRTLNRREDLASEIAESLKDLGYYSIPSAIKALKPFLQDIDYLGCKLVSVNDNSKLILLVPIKFCDLEGRILIYEEKIDYKPHSKAQEFNSILKLHQYTIDLLKAKNAVFEDVVNGDNFRSFIQKYLQVRFTAEKSARNKKLYFVSSQTQYKVLIEPILLTKIPAKCMEKSILFPYQRNTNLHVIDWSNIATLLRFLEKKYKLIESRAKKTNSIEIYQNADNKFRSSLRMASLPFLGYSVVVLVIYFSQLYFLLRLFNSIGFAAIGIYFFTIAYFYFKFYKTKKDLTSEFETPYYLQNAQFSETDLLCVKEEFADEQMAQFGYECFGKDNDSKVLEQIEKDTIKENIVAKQQERDAPQLYELDLEPKNSSIKEKPKSEVKYSSFFDD